MVDYSLVGDWLLEPLQPPIPVQLTSNESPFGLTAVRS